MIQDTFNIKVNTDAKRYEFTPKVEGFCSYTVGFHEAETIEDACIAVYNALRKSPAYQKDGWSKIEPSLKPPK